MGVTSILRLGAGWTRFLQVDELQLLHLSWLRGDGSQPAVDHFVPQFSLLVDELELMWRVVGSNFEGVWVARTQMWLVSLAILWVTFKLARRLFGRDAAIGAVVALSLFTTFNDRALDVRSDGFIALSWLLAFLWLAPGGKKRPVLAGLAFAIGFAFNFKAVAVLPFIGLMALAPDEDDVAWVRGALKRGTLLAAGIVAGLGAYLLFLAVRGDVGLYFDTLKLNFSVSTGEFEAPLWKYLKQSLGRNIPFYLLFFEGLMLAALGAWNARKWTALLWLIPIVHSLVFLKVNPTFYPYNFVNIAPFWALLVGLAVSHWLSRPGVLVLGLTMLAMLPLYRQVFLLEPTIGGQYDVNEFASTVTQPEDHVYDASGMILFRRGPFNWRMHSATRPWYNRGWYRVADQLAEHPPRLVLYGYRTGWLTKPDRLFLRTHYPTAGGIGISGWKASPAALARGPVSAELLLPGRYRIVTSPRGKELEFAIDGVAYTEPLELARGAHQVAWKGAGPAPKLMIYWAPPGMEEALTQMGRPEVWYSFHY